MGGVADVMTPQQRSRCMSRIRSKHTTPEMIVRRISHGLGFRHRLHVRRLPGTPDLVYPRLRKIIEVRGCFWHMHSCGRCRIPATRRKWWLAKLRRNVERDSTALRSLRRAGWRVLVIWECQTIKNPHALETKIARFLGS
jgi:DNA mismatch endonuclease (patch repair protein)